MFNATQDSALLSGWGVRASDWQIGVSVQQQLLPGVSAEVGYRRRWLQNFTGTVYGDRVNELDFRVAKILRFGRMRTNVGIDIYNVTNTAPALTYNQSFVLPLATTPNGSWLTPPSTLQARFLKISAQIDF